jgi:hypothetical protein
MSLQKHKNTTNDITIYPFVDELVDKLCTQETREFIHKHVKSESDKQTFMMFVFLYFAVELKLMDTTVVETALAKLDDNEEHKLGLKYIISEIIGDREKRKMCIKMFSERFRHLTL